ncbi:MAG: Hpt domain-containing protein [Bacteroidetes bacterium]|nr:Hpt domain-containing protein [Bacteroidota bacterium]
MESTLVDLTFLENFTGGDKAKMAKYINMFLQYAPNQIGIIEQKLEEKDWDSLRVAAHSLKPQVTYMGIKSQEEVIKSIEHNSADGVNLEELPTLISSFKEGVNKAITELKEHLVALS